MNRDQLWLTDAQFSKIEPHLPTDTRGKERKQEISRRPLLRDQAFGESLDPDKLERLGRYEVHLDRKLERMLAMLLRLKDLRHGTAEG